MKLWHLRWQVHRLEDLSGDGLGLDERDEAELKVTLFADDLKPECFPEKLPASRFRRRGSSGGRWQVADAGC
jgi:hypothetical protein